MKNIFRYKIHVLLLVIFISGCSTKKNTWKTRTFQAANTRFNVYFNGYVSYNDGLKNIAKANKEDYSTIIPMYPISRHTNAASATSDMDRTIEKCRKAIKLHSIKVKPAKDFKKANRPEYKQFYNQEEFNPAMDEAWLLLAKAEFHKGEFLGSVGTFSYIIRHYSSDKDVEATCQLWIARAYGELGWIYEAEQVLSKVVQNNLKRSNVGLFASVNADLLLKKRQYKEAIPFLELALAKEDNKDLRLRFRYVLAQLYQKTKNNKAAFDMYADVIKGNPPFEMEFNARINQVQLNVGSVASMRKELRKMLKNSNNKDYLDQIYYALGNTFLQHADTAKAIENYRLSAEKSIRKGVDKAVSLITLGDIYYKQKKYVLAQPCYDEASKIITNEHEDFARVSKLAQTLGELVKQHDIVVLQDSLQALGKLSEGKRMAVVEEIIRKLIADEKLQAEKVKQANDPRNRAAEAEASLAGPPISGTTPGSWYFYNPESMRAGQSDFLKKWGTRKLEDNWRRTNKSASLFAAEEKNTAALEGNDSIAKTSDSTKVKLPATVVTDNKKPEFYLNQIPLSAAQIAKSNEQISAAMFEMGEIYKNKVGDLPLALSTFDEFIRRFGTDAHVADAYFDKFMIYNQLGDKEAAERCRQLLIKNYPSSKYYKILSQSDYTERLAKMYRAQDSIYSDTYKAYNENRFTDVFTNVAFIRKNFPLSTLMPKFMFLNALSIGKQNPQDKFRLALDSLITDYPQSDVTAMAKDILALMKQGKEAQAGTSSGTLIARREEAVKAEVKEVRQSQFSTDRQTRHRLMLIGVAKKVDMNKLQYAVATFNFSRFMIKDFDLEMNAVDTARTSLSVKDFLSYEEVEAYLNSVNTEPELTKMIDNMQIQKVVISEGNYAIVRTLSSLEDYLTFQKNPPPVVTPAEPLLATKQAKKADLVVPVSKTKATKKDKQKKQLVEQMPITIETKLVEKLVKKPEDKVVAKTEEKPVEKLAEKPIESAATKATAKPAEKVDEKPVAKATEKPTEKLAEKPIENAAAKTPAKPAEKVDEKLVAKTTEKQVEKLAEKPIENVAAKSTAKPTEKAVMKPIETKKAAEVVSVPPAAKPEVKQVTVAHQPQLPPVPLYKGLFGYRANETHFVAVLILTGTFDFAKTKAAFDAFNKQNYASMNLNVTLDKQDKGQMVLIGGLPDAATGKAYLLRIVTVPALFDGLKGSTYRNLLGSQENLNTVIQKNALNTYFDFMQMYYLK